MENSNNGPFEVKPSNQIGKIILIIIVGLPSAVGLVFFLLTFITFNNTYGIVGAILLFVPIFTYLIATAIVRKSAIKKIIKDPNAKVYEGVITQVAETSRTESMGRVTVRSRYTVLLDNHPEVNTAAFGPEQFPQGTRVKVKINPRKPSYCYIVEALVPGSNSVGEIYRG